MAKEVKIPLSKEEHARLKSISALSGIPMREFCRKAIIEMMKRKKSKKNFEQK